MADSYRDIAQQLRPVPSVMLNSKGAPIDRVWTEQQTVSTSTKRPLLPSAIGSALPFPPGAAHPKCAYLICVDAYKIGGDDNNENWQVIYRLDYQAWLVANPTDGVSWPDVLAKDKLTKADEYGQNSSVIQWLFDVINPDSYTAPSLNTAHPLHATAKLVHETQQRNGPLATISRRYEKLAALPDYVVDDENAIVRSVVRQTIHSVSAPSVVAGEDVQQQALGTEFSARTVRTITAGGTRTDFVVDDETGATHEVKREVVNAITTPTPVTGSTIRQNALDGAWSRKVSERIVSGGTRTDYEFDEETQSQISIVREIVNSVSAPTEPAGSSVTQKQLNGAWSLRITRSIPSIGALGYQYYDYIDMTIPRLLTGVRTLVFGGESRFEPLIRGAIHRKVSARVVVDFFNFASDPAPSAVFQFYPTDIDYRGITLQVGIGSVIADAWSFFTTGGVTEEYTSPESSPTYTEYLALIGTEVLINERLEPWRFGLKRRSRIYVTLF